jgi:hypothetical protein
MIETVHAFLKTPLGVGILGGILTAARVDYAAFKAWHSWHDLQSYSWGVASFRWVQGAIIGAATAAGLAAVL